MTSFINFSLGRMVIKAEYLDDLECEIGETCPVCGERVLAIQVLDSTWIESVINKSRASLEVFLKTFNEEMKEKTKICVYCPMKDITLEGVMAFMKEEEEIESHIGGPLSHEGQLGRIGNTKPESWEEVIQVLEEDETYEPWEYERIP